VTACSVWSTGSAAYLLTDRAGFHADGRVLGFARKVATVPHLRLAVAANGEGFNGMAEWIAENLAAEPTQAAALALLPRVVGLVEQTVCDMAAADRSGHQGMPIVQLFAAAWLATEQRAAAYVIGGQRHMFDASYASGTLRRVGSAISPTIPGFRPVIGGGADQIASARTIIDAQRRQVDEAGVCRVGGTADLTIVTAGGVRCSKLCSWPDRAGERVAN